MNLRKRVRHAVCEILRTMIAKKDRLVISRHSYDDTVAVIYVGHRQQNKSIPPAAAGAILDLTRSSNPSSVYRGVDVDYPSNFEFDLKRVNVYLHLGADAHILLIEPPSSNDDDDVSPFSIKFPLWSHRSDIGKNAHSLVSGRSNYDRTAIIQFLENIAQRDCEKFPILKKTVVTFGTHSEEQDFFRNREPGRSFNRGPTRVPMRNVKRKRKLHVPRPDVPIHEAMLTKKRRNAENVERLQKQAYEIHRNKMTTPSTRHLFPPFYIWKAYFARKMPFAMGVAKLSAEELQKHMAKANIHAARKRSPVEEIMEYMMGNMHASSQAQLNTLAKYEKHLKTNQVYNKKVDDAYAIQKENITRRLSNSMVSNFPSPSLWRAIWRRHDHRQSLESAIHATDTKSRWDAHVNHAKQKVTWSSPILNIITHMYNQGV
jgi:hypothetical protein